MKNALCFIAVAYVLLILVVLFFYVRRYIMPKLKRKFLKYKIEKERVPVLRTEYIPERISQAPRYRTLTSRVFPEEYNVYFVYGYGNHVINDKALYERVVAGENTFEVLIHKGYSKNGKIKHVYYTLP